MPEETRKFSVKLKPETKQQFQQIRENKLLILGVLIGIVGNLFANIIDSYFKNNNTYPIVYSISISIIFLIIISLTHKTYFKWNLRISKMQRLLTKVKKHQKNRTRQT